jgi:hypothetical protein
MADITAFPTIRNVLVDGENIKDYIAGATVLPGQVVAFAATGVDKTVHPAVKGTTGQPIGVAIYGASTGGRVAVACAGCRVYVANADDTTAVDTGDTLEVNDCAVGGTVSALALAGALAMRYYVGFADGDIAGGGTGIATVQPGIVIDAAS